MISHGKETKYFSNIDSSLWSLTENRTPTGQDEFVRWSVRISQLLRGGSPQCGNVRRTVALQRQLQPCPQINAAKYTRLPEVSRRISESATARTDRAPIIKALLHLH